MDKTFLGTFFGKPIDKNSTVDELLEVIKFLRDEQVRKEAEAQERIEFWRGMFNGVAK